MPTNNGAKKANDIVTEKDTNKRARIAQFAFKSSNSHHCVKVRKLMRICNTTLIPSLFVKKEFEPGECSEAPKS